jgi:hypothetical protein
MTTSELERAALALYGPMWRRELSKDLDVDISTLRRWMEHETVSRMVELAVEGLHARGVTVP